MNYIMLIMIMFAGCATTGIQSDDLGHMSDEQLQVAQPVSNSPKPPDWVLGREHNSFHRSEYLVGVGFSKKNTVSASESARAELSKNIRFKLAAVMKDYSSNDGSFVESFVKTEIDSFLEGVHIKDGWYDSEKKVYYSFAVVKRKDVLATIQDQINSAATTSISTMTQATGFFDNGEILKSLVYYYDGYNESSQLLPLVRTYKSVSLLPEIPPIAANVPSSIDFKEKIQSIIGNIEVEKVSDNMVVRGNDVSFAVKSTYNGRPLHDLPFRFHGNYYNFISKGLSNRSGICKVKANQRKIFNEKDTVAKVEAEIDLFSLAKRFNYKLKRDLFGRLETLDVTFKTFKKHNFNFSLNRKIIKIGQRAVFNVHSDVSGYLTIHSQKTVDDTPSQVFPNINLKDNYIQKNKVYHIGSAGYPFYFRVTGPASQEFVTAVLYRDEEMTEVLGQQIYEYEVVEER